MAQVFSCVEPYAPRTDDGHTLAHRLLIAQHIQVAHHFRMVYAFYLGRVGRDARGKDHLIKGGQQLLICTGVQFQVNACQRYLPFEIADGLIEFLLARYLLRDVELPSYLALCLEQRHAVAALCRHRCGSQSCWPCAYHSNFLHLLGGQIVQLRFVACPRIDEATGQFALEDVVQTCLIATYAGVDLVLPPLLCLDNQFGIGKERTCHTHHVGMAVCEYLLGHFGHVDTVGSDERNVHLALHLLRYPCKSTARHHGGNGGDARLMPTDTCIDDGDARLFQLLGQMHHLLPCAAALHAIHHAEAENDDELPAHGFAHSPHHFERKTDAVLVAAAIFVCAEIGALGNELIDEIAFGAHDLHPVIVGILRQLGRTGKVGNGAGNAPLAQCPWFERTDGRLHRAGCHTEGMIAIAACVQYLHGYLATVLVHRFGHHLVLVGCAAVAESAGEGACPTGDVWGYASRNDKSNAPCGTLAKVGGHLLIAALFLFEAGVHAAHKGAVAQRGETKVERSEEMRILRMGHGGYCFRSRPKDEGFFVRCRVVGLDCFVPCNDDTGNVIAQKNQAPTELLPSGLQ